VTNYFSKAIVFPLGELCLSSVSFAVKRKNNYITRKKKEMKVICKFLVLSLGFNLLTGILAAQPSAPPVMPDQHGNNGNYTTSTAPIDDGTEVMIFMGMVYLAGRINAGKRRSGAGTKPVNF
jgi:hypothetical protein